ncbi:MAG: response regulator [Bacteroidetes bacterium]|jgi:CheY-like chemotaxis protein|nr:response regulator [Bacteroidota bacterium]MBT4384385.1 response regulator [Candidatus Peregrinibacteria bacterium]MBT4632239.1 response regulator [Candidatus Peregrinibacteria bacterium]MBT5516682.1 response regulator [Candidatus Peregrinibacteria bacterium]MBT5824350.1 response regulator [Candidatus Peregrinibacteria bacterium]
MTKTILLIEDEEVLQKAISEKLKAAGMKTVIFSNGDEAIEHLSKNTDLPNLIWLDYYLKGDLNGLGFLTQVKSNINTKSIPVIVVSNSASDSKVQNMLSLGANKYMLKAAHRLDEIIDHVKELTEA